MLVRELKPDLIDFGVAAVPEFGFVGRKLRLRGVVFDVLKYLMLDEAVRFVAF